VDAFEAMLQPIGEALISEAALRGPENAADIGCGGGATSLALARLLSDGGRVTGVDIAPQLAAEAQKRASAQGLANTCFEAGDAQSFTPTHAPFDVVFSRFGVMFFDDTLAAFRNMRGWLKPGGKMTFATWGAPEANPWMTQIHGITAKYVEPEPQDPAGPGPFRLADEAATKTMMEQAGFGDIILHRWECDQPIAGKGATPAQALQFALDGLEIGKALANLDEETRSRALDEYSALFESNYRDGSVLLKATVLFVTGRN
jgi:SAM-dependent methyltransferase